MSDDLSKQPVWTRSETIIVPSPSTEQRIGIRLLDWEYCKKRIDKTNNQIPRLHLVYSYLLGISTTTLFQSISLVVQNQYTLIYWIYIIIFLFSTSVAIIFIFVDRQIHINKRSDINDIVEYMNDIEKTFKSKS